MPIGIALGGAAIAGAATIGAGALSASAQKKAAQKASDTTLAATQENNALAREVRSSNLQIASPFYNNGLLAGNALTDLLLGTHEYNPAVVANPSVPGGGTLPTPTPTPTTGSALAPYTGPDLAAIEALRHDGIKGNHDQAMSVYRQAHPAGVQSNPVFSQTPVPTPTPTPTPTPAPGSTGAPSSALDAFDRFRQGTNYQWRLNQGANALTSNLARGTLDSGAAQKSILEYGQNFASNELGNYMNLLASQQASGLTAAGAVMGVNTNYQGNVTANNNNAANASSNAALVAGQGQANMWGGVANAGGQIGGALFQYGMRPTAPTSYVPSLQSSNPGGANYIPAFPTGGF
jgi:hypothetical protein